jgi:putative membrane protein
MGVMMLVFWGILAALVVYVVRNVVQRPPDAPRAGRADDPLRILDERLARGDIDVDEYRQRRDLLAPRPPPSGG